MIVLFLDIQFLSFKDLIYLHHTCRGIKNLRNWRIIFSNVSQNVTKLLEDVEKTTKQCEEELAKSDPELKKIDEAMKKVTPNDIKALKVVL